MAAEETFQLTDALIAELQTMDTPTVCNALELLVPAVVATVIPPSICIARARSCRP